MPEPTIHDVARRARVSVATVSRVLNGHTTVAEPTRERVMEAIRHLGYRPNAVARTLVRRRSFAVGVLVPDIANPFFAEVARGMGDVAAAHGYHLILANSDGNVAKEVDFIALFRDKQVDGLIYTSGTLSPEHMAAFGRLGRPVVLAATMEPTGRVPAVLVDSLAGGRVAMEHVLGLGHRRVACIAGPAGDPIAGAPRLQGNLEVARRHGVRIPPELIIDGEFGLEAGYWAMDRLLNAQPRPTAVVAASDLTAIGALGAILDRGLRVPQDISVVGFDNITLAMAVRPRLTTVAQPMYDIGARAMGILAQIIAGRPPEPAVQWIPPQLVARDSTGKPPP